MYEYRATLVRVIDGDTIVANIDLGMHIHVEQIIRLVGVNAPERNTPAGAEATAWLNAALGVPGVNNLLVIRTSKDKQEKYGRWLGEILVGLVNVNEALVATGNAVVYKP